MTDVDAQDQATLETLMRFYAAESAYCEAGGGDFSAIAATLTPDVVLRIPESLSYGGEYHGPEQFEAWSTAFADVWAELAVTDARYYPSGDRIFVEANCSAVIRRNGKAINFPLYQYIIVKDGRIKELRPLYWDTKAVLDAINA